MPEVFYQREGTPASWDMVGVPAVTTVQLAAPTTLHYADGSPDDTLLATTAAIVWGTADTTFDRRGYGYLIFTIVGSETLSVVRHDLLSTVTGDYAILGQVKLGGILPWQQGSGALDITDGVFHIPVDCLEFPNHAEICNETPSEFHYTMDATAEAPKTHKQSVTSYIFPEGHELRENVAEGTETDTSYEDAVMADSPLAFWPLATETEGVTPDITEHGFDGTLQGATTIGDVGMGCRRGGLGASFTAADWIDCHIEAGLPLAESWSADGWIRGPLGGTSAVPLAWGSYGSPNYTEFFLYGPTWPVLLTGPRFYVSIGEEGEYANPAFDDSATFHYWAVTWDRASEHDVDGTPMVYLKVYWDAVLISTDEVPIPSTDLYTAPDFLSIGALPTSISTLGDDTQDCQMDHVALYLSVLSPERIAAHYAAGTTCAGEEHAMELRSPEGVLMWRHDGATMRIYSDGVEVISFGAP